MNFIANESSDRRFQEKISSENNFVTARSVKTRFRLISPSEFEKHNKRRLTFVFRLTLLRLTLLQQYTVVGHEPEDLDAKQFLVSCDCIKKPFNQNRLSFKNSLLTENPSAFHANSS